MMLNQISKTNPQMANYLNNAMQSGRNPKDILQEGIQNGDINKNTFNQLKQAYNQYGRFLPKEFKVSKSTFDELESMFNQNNNFGNNPTSNNSNGFRF
ncbi:MAG: hypothetical protein ACI4WW_02585 [Candidatus Coprovivens sp.]